MPVPLPDPDAVDLTKPDAALAQHITGGLVSAAQGPTGLTPLQRALIESIAVSMTGWPVTVDVDVMEPETFAQGLAGRDEAFRIRILQTMILAALVVRPLPDETAARLDAFATALSVGDGMLAVAHDFATESFGLAAVDFDRNGYTRDWSHEHHSVLHTSEELQDAWATSPGQLSHTGVAVGLADAMRRGALVRGSVDFMDLDWFELAPLTIDEARDHFGVVPKAEAAIAAGSVGPWELGGISAFQLREGRRHADARGVPYESFGAGRRDEAHDLRVP